MPVLPDSILRRMSKEDRKPLGKAGLTSAECQEKIDIKTERELQKQVAAILRQHNIAFNVSRMDRRKTDKTGWPDFTFAINGTPCAFECKLPGKKLSPEQNKVVAAMLFNGWRVYPITSLDEAIAVIRHFEKE